jgi:hypothetical protein
LALLIRVILKLGSSDQLDDLDERWHPSLQGTHEGSCSVRTGSSMHFQSIPLRDNVSSGKMFKYQVRQGPNVTCIHFHDVCRLLRRIVSLFSYRTGACLWLFLADMRFGKGSFNTPRSFSFLIILPTAEGDEANPLRRKSITSLSLPHLGYSYFSVSTAAANSIE